MVWNSTQSALYRSINRHNGDCSEGEFRREESVEEKAENACRDRAPKNGEKNVCGETKNRCENCPRYRACSAPSDPISRIMSDRDMLLIAGLIFVFMRENADKTMILALAIVLLG